MLHHVVCNTIYHQYDSMFHHNSIQIRSFCSFNSKLIRSTLENQLLFFCNTKLKEINSFF